jgi:hypothetical protein
VSDQPHSWAGWKHLPFRPISPGAARAVVFLFVLSLVIGALNFAWTSRVVNAAAGRVQALCRFDADLGAVPLTVPKGARASRFGVLIISDARAAWRRTGCPGRLGPPDPSFTKWATFYHLPTG